MMSCIVNLRLATTLFVATAGSLASAPRSWAAPAVSPNSVRMAEYLYYSIPKSGILADWLDSVKMSPNRRTELKEFADSLKQKKAKVPSIEWLPGAGTIKIGSGARIYKVGFDKILARRELTVNGVAFSAAAEDDFVEMAKKLSQLAAPKEGSFEGLIAVLFYQFGLDEADACNSPTGAGACASKTDAAVIKNLVGSGGTISSFQCEGRKFSAIGLSRPSGASQDRITTAIAYEYDPKGRANKVSLVVQGQALCNFTLAEGRFVSVEDIAPGRSNCDGRAASEWNGTFHPLHPGDIPKIFALVPIPIQRLQGCCADHICREEIAAAIATAASPTTAAADL